MKRAVEAAPEAAAKRPKPSLWGPADELCTLPQLEEARLRLKAAPDIIRTPLVPLSLPTTAADATAAASSSPASLLVKLENLQTCGSFKIRGMKNKLLKSGVDELRRKGMLTFSAGNAGRAVAYLGKSLDIPTKIVMPNTVPAERRTLLEALGATVEQVPSPELLDTVTARLEEEGRLLVHPFDDLDLICGHASCGLEILEDCPDVDVVVVCCGGGGFAAGVASAVKLSGSKARVLAVEPEGAQSMRISFDRGEQSWCPGGKVDTICHGLAPPFAGKATFNHCRKFVDEVVLVTDADVKAAVRLLFEAGHVVEASGAAAVAAVLAGKCGDLSGKKVVCTLSGRNISSQDLASFFS
eukprot:TRINITY_DN11717_c0_g1_i4.p1 TRINITY_DN11717_c0_g1~~TRINITY_DN11717_c0_g1_i4.p1  ORF type:complete len:394 (-),score=109.39 TRINITY_DN11717_c0_g1_i4:173-1237(-)